MQVLTFDKKFLLEKLTENRERHEGIYNESLVSYREEVLRQLSDLSEQMKLKARELATCYKTTVKHEDKTDDYVGCDFSICNIHVSKPVSHLIDYDRTMLMIENCQQNDIELTEREYAQYVMDNWDWQQTFMTSNAAWSPAAVSGCLSMGYN